MIEFPAGWRAESRALVRTLDEEGQSSRGLRQLETRARQPEVPEPEGPVDWAVAVGQARTVSWSVHAGPVLEMNTGRGASEGDRTTEPS